MGLNVNSRYQYLTSNLTVGAKETTWRLITGHVLWGGSSATNSLAKLTNDDESRQVRLAVGYGSGTYGVRGGADNGGGFKSNAYGNNVPTNEWAAVAVLVGPNNGVSNAVLKTYINGVQSWRLTTLAYSTVEDILLDVIYIGAYPTTGDANHVRGWVADVAVWEPVDESEGDAIALEAVTKTADAVTAGSPLWYAPLYDDGSVSIGGSTLTPVAPPTTQPTYSTTDHPILLGAGATAPDAPTIGSVGSITHNAARVSWTDNSSDETGFAVEYGVSVSNVVASWTAASNSPAATNAAYLDITGLTPETTYKARVRAFNAAGESSWAETSEFTTSAAPGATKGVRVTLGDGTTPAASLSGLSVRWWDGVPAGAPDFEANSLTTDAQGLLEIDIDSATSLNLDDLGYLLVYKTGAAPADDLIAAGRTAVVDIS